MESLAESADTKVIDVIKVLFLQKNTNIFTSNNYATKDDTYKNLKRLINNNEIVILTDDKDYRLYICWI